MKPIATDSADLANQDPQNPQTAAASKRSISKQVLGWVGVSALMLAPLTVLTFADGALADHRCQNNVRQTSYRRSSGAVYYRNVGTSSCNRSTTRTVSVRQVGYVGLRRGDEGPAVELLQQRLNQLRFFLTVDGVFGWETEDAVRRFQRGAGLRADGIVGPETQQALFRGDYVASNTVNYRPGCNGSVSFPNNCIPITYPNNPPSDGWWAGDRNRYVVLIPNSGNQLRDVQRLVPGATVIRSPLGTYIRVSSFPDRGDAESLSDRMRARGFDSQVRYF